MLKNLKQKEKESCKPFTITPIFYMMLLASYLEPPDRMTS